MQMANSEVATAVNLLQQLHGDLPACVAALNAVHGSGGPIQAQPVEGAAHAKAGKASASDAAAAGSRPASPAAALLSGDEPDGEATAHQQITECSKTRQVQHVVGLQCFLPCSTS